MELKELEEKISLIIRQKITYFDLNETDLFIDTELGNELYYSTSVGELHVCCMPKLDYGENHFPVSVLNKVREVLIKYFKER